MTNHVHLVVAPATAEALGPAMRAIHSQYTAHVNRRMGWTGHLWEGRFYSTPLDEPHFWSAVRYVERNPIRAHLVRSTRTGRPCGSEQFVRKLQALLGRPLIPAQRGRKPRQPGRERPAGARKEK